MIPLKDNVPTRNFPIVTVGLIAANVAVWFWEWKTGVSTEVLHYGYYPCTLAGPCDPRFVPPDHLSWYDGLFTSMFMHASWFHIGGNMLFLWIFGNNVEDSMGRVRFFFWYIAAGLAAAFAQTFVTLQYSDPVPAFLFLGIWFLLQLWEGGFAVLHPELGGGVAFFAHIGGFAFGALTIGLVAKQRPLPPVTQWTRS